MQSKSMTLIKAISKYFFKDTNKSVECSQYIYKRKIIQIIKKYYS